MSLVTRLVTHFSDVSSLTNDISTIMSIEPSPTVMALPTLSPMLSPTYIEIDEYDTANNLLDQNIREKFASDLSFNDDMILFTSAECTTITMGGLFANVQFKEAELIEWINPDEDILCIKCNYGELVYPGYIEPVKKRSCRGRKRKEKSLISGKQRKKSGTGKHFNSQLSFYVRSSFGDPIVDNHIDYYSVPTATPIYKFKVFRTGKIQLPGVRPHLVQDVISRSQCIARMLNLYLHAGETDPNKLVKMIYINPVMKNYKFRLLLDENRLIDLSMLKKILLGLVPVQKRTPTIIIDDKIEPVGLPINCSDSLNDVLVATPSIFDIKYTREDIKLSIKFSTPIYKKPKKCTRINIFMLGKINILGAFDIDITLRICEFLHKIFDEFASEIMVPMHVEHKINLCDNIENTEITSEEFERMLFDHIYCLPKLPLMTHEDITDINNLIDECYTEVITKKNEYVNSVIEEVIAG